MSNPTIQSQNSQPMHPDKARANLGLITQLLQHNVPPAPPQPPQTQETAPQQPQTPPEPQTPKPDENEAKMNELELNITKKLDDLRKELGEKHKTELDNLKLQIEKALSEEDNESNEIT